MAFRKHSNGNRKTKVMVKQKLTKQNDTLYI